MPGCNVTRRDVLRRSAGALASPIVLHGDFLSRVAAATGRTDDVSPANLELVTYFYKSRSDLAREWSERSRQQISGAWPLFALGSSVQDHNTVVKHDLSNLHRI